MENPTESSVGGRSRIPVPIRDGGQHRNASQGSPRSPMTSPSRLSAQFPTASSSKIPVLSSKLSPQHVQKDAKNVAYSKNTTSCSISPRPSSPSTSSVYSHTTIPSHDSSLVDSPQITPQNTRSYQSILNEDDKSDERVSPALESDSLFQSRGLYFKEDDTDDKSNSNVSTEFASTIKMDDSPCHKADLVSDVQQEKNILSHFLQTEGLPAHSSPSVLYPFSLVTQRELGSGFPSEEPFSKPNPPQRTDSMESIAAQSDTSTLSFSTISIPSKVSVLSVKESDNVTLTNLLTSRQHMPETSDASRDALKLETLLSGQGNTLLKSNLDEVESTKDSVEKELQETRSMVEFLENENRTLRERCSKSEVNISSLELMVAQLEEKADRLKHEHMLQTEQATESELIEREKLLEQLSQLMQNKEAVTDKLLALQKEHALCTKQFHIASTANLDTEKQVTSLKVELHTTQDKVRQLQDALRNAEKEINVTQRNLELEKGHSNEVEMSLDSTRQMLERTTKKLEDVHQQNTLKDDLLSRKESQLSLIQGELNKIKEDYHSATSSCQSLTVEVQMISKDLNSKKEQLLEAQKRREASETSIKELGEKLSSSEREITEKNIMLMREKKENEQLAIEITTLKNMIQDLEHLVSLKDATLSKQEREMASVIVQKENAEALNTERESELKSAQFSKVHEIAELNKQVAYFDAQSKQLKESISKKDEVIKSLTLQNKSLQSTLEFEREEKSSLNYEATSLKEKIQAVEEQCQHLEKEKQNLSFEAETKAKASDDAENSMRKHLQALEKETKLKDTKLHSTMVQLSQKETELERALGKISDLHTQIALLTADIHNSKELADGLQTKLQLLQESKHQEISELKQHLEAKKSEALRLSSHLNSLQTELKEKDTIIRSEREVVKKEKTTSEELQTKLLTSELDKNSLQAQLLHSEDHNKKLKTELEEQKQQWKTTEENRITLSVQIQDIQRQLKQSEQICKEERQRFTEIMASTSIQHKEEIEKKTQNADRLNKTCKQLQESLLETQRQLETSKSELSNITTTLNAKEDEYHKLQVSMENEVALHKKVSTQLMHLQAKYDDICVKEKELDSLVKLQKTDLDQTCETLKDVQDHCATLQQELQVQNEVNTSTKKRLEEKNRDMATKFEQEVEELNQKFDKSEATVNELSGQLSQIQKEYKALQTQLSKSHNTLDELRTQLAEKKATVTANNQKISQLEKTIEQEKAAKIQAQESLTRELAQHHELDNELVQLREKVCQLTTSRVSLKVLLEKEKTNVVSMKEQIQKLKMEQELLQSTLKKEKDNYLADKTKAENEKSAIKHKYHSEKKILKETLKSLQTEGQVLRATVEARTGEVTKLERELDSLQEEKDSLNRKKSETDEQLKEKKEALRTAEVRIKSQEVQLVKLQNEVDELSQAQLHFEECRKNMEAAHRDELQRVLAEVTEHMEQQYSAHRYLEKLRAENESIALKEKERKIGQLKSEIKMQKKELKQEKLHSESLSLEAKYLKSRHKDHELSRHKVEARLGKVNEMLSNTIGSTMSTSLHLPVSSSTPLNYKQ